MAESKQHIQITTGANTSGIDEVIKKQDQLKKRSDELNKKRSKGNADEKAEVRSVRREQEKSDNSSGGRSARRERGGSGRSGVSRTAGAVGRVARMTGMRGAAQAASGVSNIARLGAVAGAAAAPVALAAALGVLAGKMNAGANKAAEMAKELDKMSSTDAAAYLKKLGEGAKLFKENGATLTALGNEMEKFQANPGFWGGMGASLAPMKQGIYEQLNQLDRSGAGQKVGDAIMGFLTGQSGDEYAKFREKTNEANKIRNADKDIEANEGRMAQKLAEMREEAELRMLKGGAKTRRLDEMIAEQKNVFYDKETSSGKREEAANKMMSLQKMRTDNELERREARESAGKGQYDNFDTGTLHNARSAMIAAEASAASERAATETSEADFAAFAAVQETTADGVREIAGLLKGNRLKVNAVYAE